ncbi:MAG: FtsX-like permease family protein [Candidatus Korobacteraceae bacterium]
MPRLRIFHWLIIRPFFREPLRTALVVLAVALGVAVVIAIELAGNSAAGSFRSSIETLTGNTDLEVTAIGGVPDKVVGRLATLPYAIQVRPRMEDYAVVAATGQTIPLIGLDLVADHPADLNSADQNLTTGEALHEAARGTSVWVSEHLGVKAGDKLRLQINDRTGEYMVRAVLKDSGDSGSFVIMDIATAQRALQRPDRVDRVLLKVPSTPPVEEWEQRIRSALPAGVELRREGAQTDENRRMLSAFRWNLRILSYVALVVGAFLIFNTISVSVVRRRPEIGIVRALGASRVDVLAAFLGEAMCFGVAGALLGIVLGRVMATEAVRLLGATVQNLYVSSRPGAIEITSGIVALGLLIGVGMALASAASPAREASLVSPVEAMARGEREYAARVHKVRDLWIALVLALLGAGASQGSPIAGKPFFGYAAALLMIGASAFAIPALVGGLTKLSSGFLRRMLGIEAMLASRSLASSLRRTSVLVGALSTAIAMTTAVGIMVGSFRQTVVVWMNDQLKADLFLRPAGDPASDRYPTLDPSLADKIAALPGVAGVDRFRGYDISYQGLPATLGSADTRGSHDLAKIHFLSGRPSSLVDAELRSGNNAVVSEPFANKHHVRAGDSITLPLGEARVNFRVVDVFYDYGSEKGFIVVERSTLLRYLPDPAPSSIGVYVAPGANVDTVRAEVEKTVAGRNVLIFTNRNLRAEAIQIFDRTFAITYALEVVAIIVAIIGIAGALLALVIDRRRELGLLRFLGAAVSQIRKLILVEAGLIGLLANVAGLALGIVLSLLLIFVINKQSFGWTIQFHWPVAVLLGSLTLVYLVTVLAGFYPARVATRLKPIEVVHEE